MFPVNTPDNVAPVFVPTPYSNFDGEDNQLVSADNVSDNQDADSVEEDIEIVRPTYSSAIPTVNVASLNKLLLSSRQSTTELISNNRNKVTSSNLVTERASSGVSPVYSPGGTTPLLLHSSSSYTSLLKASSSSSQSKTGQKGKKAFEIELLKETKLSHFQFSILCAHTNSHIAYVS